MGVGVYGSRAPADKDNENRVNGVRRVKAFSFWFKALGFGCRFSG